MIVSRNFSHVVLIAAGNLKKRVIVFLVLTAFYIKRIDFVIFLNMQIVKQSFSLRLVFFLTDIFSSKNLQLLQVLLALKLAYKWVNVLHVYDINCSRVH